MTKSNNKMNNEIHDSLKTFGLSRIKEIILKSEKENREYGFRFCKNDVIKPTDICVGDECYVGLKHCPGEAKVIGSYHTHPINPKGKINFLSDVDIHHELNDKSNFACIGVTENNTPTIKCYISPYGIDKTIADKRNNSKKEYNIKITEYNPSSTKSGYLELKKQQPEKIEELNNLWEKYLLADEELEKKSRRAALKLLKQPNEGADIIIRL